MTTPSRNYTTIHDAAHAVREQCPDATEALIDILTDRAWREQETVEEACRALDAQGIDVEGY